MKRISAAAAILAVALLALTTSALPASAAASNEFGERASSILLSTEDAARLPPGTIGLCNAGWGDVSVQRYDNARFLGVVDLRCGDSKSGYVHVRANHQNQWQSRINAVGGSGNWDDLMAWATGEALRAPEAGYPKDVGGGKWCYTAPIFMSGPRGTVQYKPTIIVSTNNKLVITSYPSTNTAC